MQAMNEVEAEPQVRPRNPVLKEARALLRKGWGQGDMERVVPGEPVQYCINGALAQAALTDGREDHPDLENARYALACATGRTPGMFGDGGTGILLRWNDADGRTENQVVELVDKALEGEHGEA